MRSGVDDGKVKIGLFAPQSGVFASFGQDMKRSYDLYLSRHGGRLGGREVETVLADEGATPQTAVTAAQKVLQADRISVLTGIVSSASGLAVRPMAEVTRTPTVITVAGAGALTGSRGSDYVWRVGFGNAQPSYALGRSLAAKPDLVDKKFFLIAPGFAGGAETVEGFRRGFVEGGGKVVGRHFTVLGETSNFQPALQAAVQAGADDVFAFYAGSEALGFIQQYRRFGFADRLGLYGAGDLSDPHVLASAGAAAEGVQVAQTWSAELDTPANRAFVTAYEDAYHAVPSIASMNQYDAMVVLDQAVSGIRGPVTDKALIDALKNLGEVRNSVRGPWTFDPNHHDPYQTIYLLRVVKEGGRFVNKVVGDLGKVGFVNVESDV
ncbi:ABC transporter substrate-binding protein [Pseudonocardia acaciae]|uniref:ABC transporter substrate-binding protein n=1 Tax=Pseudonocardia acaciae TaxID=551276 RepID=UPI00048CCB81|nr:ABC transporter substrate-binding protein [Pseudonocardia acaciae]